MDGASEARIYQGDPPFGDFCPATLPGSGYVSTGYAAAA